MAIDWRIRTAFFLGLAFALFQLIVPVFVPLYDMQLRALHVLLAIAGIAADRADDHGRSEMVDAEGSVVGYRPDRVGRSRPTSWSFSTGRTSSASPVQCDGRPDSLVIGTRMMVAVLEAARRAAGSAIPIFVLLIFGYVFMGPIMPGIWTHPGFPLEHVVIESLYYSSGGVLVR